MTKITHPLWVLFLFRVAVNGTAAHSALYTEHVEMGVIMLHSFAFEWPSLENDIMIVYAESHKRFFFFSSVDVLGPA